MELDPPQLPQAPPAPPYFYDHHESPGDDFHRSSAPSEDIWKKFELLPSPPASPLPPGPAEDAAADYLLEPGRLLGNLSAFVLRDCMWSGFSARERLEKAMGEKLTAKPPAQGPPAAAPTAAQAPHDAALGGLCVAPGAVFAWPADCKLPPSSGSESQSESEGEEIDVVTVEKRQSLGVRKPVTITVRADPLDPCMKRFHISIHQQQHNYAARSPPEACSCTAALEKSSQEEEEEEEEEEDGGAQSLRQVAEPSSLEPFLLKSGSAPSSDSEDVTKRKNHNYLERKRRNDLRSRFLALRDQVPGLATCPKTPKVVVLSKASEYLQSLLKAEQQMVAEKKLLKLHQLQLLKRISYLKSAH
ncbi:protein L-Myc [Podarcis raffonei]|uniref:protein L-Myc n=1 Tax=Podarcis raffonei TaxID=65483 RepID=UPI0023297692|nr:protein L-Myc [Podarcis raffonei]